MASPKSGWKKGLLIVAVVSVSAFLFLIVGAGMVLLWAMSTADSLGEPTAEAVSRTIAIAEFAPPEVATLRSHGEIPNDLTVTIPEGVPIDLELNLSAGETRTDLGGLTLVDLEADLSMGEHHLDFSRPLAQQLARVQVSGSMGDVNLENLGNARALEFETSSSMGNFNVDLGGAWPVETVAELVFNHSMGELRLNVPESVRIATDSESSVRLGDSGDLDVVDGGADPSAPVVRLHISTTMGETRFRRY